MKKGSGRFERVHAVALLFVLAVHGAVLYGLWSMRVIPHPADVVPLFVTLISPSSPPPRPQAAPQPASPGQQKPVKRETARPVEPLHDQLAAAAPAVSPAEATVPLPAPGPVIASPEFGPPGPPSFPSRAVGPVPLTSDLALVCPERAKPPYPPLSRRLGETGTVVLRVELDETGRVSAATVITSSGYRRLDTAAIAAAKTWRCQPAQRDGLAVRSVATQPFDFTLEGQ